MTSPVRTLVFDEIDSTNAEARRLAETGETGPMWIAAHRQSAGKGRRGRTWESPSGNLAATFLATTGHAAPEAAQISFVAALAAADMIATYVDPASVKVKWPNDVMIGDEKVCGILVESGRAGEGALWVAVGIGANLSEAPRVTERPATTVAAHMDGPPPPMEDALEELAELFAQWLGVWDRLGFGPIAEAWRARAYGLGQRATARLPAETLAGIAEGLDEDGALRLRLDDGTVRRITAGDVFFGEA